VPVSVLFISDDSDLVYREHWYSLDIRTVTSSYENTMNVIDALPSAETVFDAVVICCTHLPKELWNTSTRGLPSDALFIAEQIRSLPQHSCMYDGRKWRVIPIVLICPGVSFAEASNSLATEHPSGLLDDVELVETGKAPRRSRR
jgi:hypothetical protein